MAFLSLGPMLPTVEISVDFANDPTSSTRTWVDITPHVREFSTRRGRPDALSRIGTGTLALILQNQDGRFDPTYAGSLVNLIPNPSAEVNADGFIANTGTPLVSRSTTRAESGTASFKAEVVSTGAMSVEFREVDTDPLAATAGTQYTFSVYMTDGGSYGRTFNARIVFRDSGGSTLLTTDGTGAVITTAFGRLAVTATAPANTVDCRLIVRTTSATMGELFYLDAAQLEAAATASTYTDGSLDNCRWAGTAHASTSYRGGPYSPNVLPMRRIRVLAQWAAVTYNVFHGYIEDWPLSFPDLNRNALVHVKAVDALAVLPLFDLAGQSYASQLSSVRGSAVFTTCGFGTADMSISAGQSTLVASGTISANTDALSHLLDVQASENGLVFADTGGTLVFQDRHFRAKNRSTSSGTIGTGGGLIGYRDIRTAYGVSDLWNAISVTANGGTAETAVDTASTASFYRRSLSWPVGGSYLVASQSEALNAAQYIRGLYSQPALRVPEVAVVGAGGTANWATILGFEISSRATIAHVTPAGGTITGDKYVEGIGHEVTFERDWETGLQLSDAPAQAVWIAGDTANSLAGETTRAGY